MVERFLTNLWECLTARAAERRVYHGEEGEDDRALTELSRTNRWPGQEVELEALPDGWQLRVFSCHGTDVYATGYANHTAGPEILIHIPSDPNKPPTVREVIHERPE
jgi:hypothetical protein